MGNLLHRRPISRLHLRNLLHRRPISRLHLHNLLHRHLINHPHMGNLSHRHPINRLRLGNLVRCRPISRLHLHLRNLPRRLTSRRIVRNRWAFRRLQRPLSRRHIREWRRSRCRRRPVVHHTSASSSALWPCFC